jgi:hypothetical protein
MKDIIRCNAHHRVALKGCILSYQKDLEICLFGLSLVLDTKGMPVMNQSSFRPQGIFEEKEIIILTEIVDLSLTRGVKTEEYAH